MPAKKVSTRITSMSQLDERPVYQALALPNEAIANGGLEILRAGIIDDELFVSARHAFKDPAQWGEVLADITRRLALLYSMETDLEEAEAIAEIEEAYAAAMGARVVEDPKARRKPAVRAKTKPAARAKTKPKRVAPRRARKPAKRPLTRKR
jgi:hypothetical protein